MCIYCVVGSEVIGAAAVEGDVDADLALEGRQRFDAQVGDGDEDAADGDDGEHARCCRAGRLFTQQPDGALPRQTRHNLRLHAVTDTA